MLTYRENNITVSFGKKGGNHYEKTSYPQRYGCYHEVETAIALYQFNLEGEVIFMRSKGPDWPHRQEWLKRTVGNDWVYYSTGGYTGVYEALGEFYLPNLPYPTNSLLGGRPFQSEPVTRLLANWYNDVIDCLGNLNGAPEEINLLAESIMANSPEVMADKAKALFQIMDGRISVLPPDSRHVDYNIIPLTVASGCLYKCKFCRVKTPHPFRAKSRSQIDRQIDQLKDFFGADLVNYNAVFLGEHDALCAEKECLLYAVERSFTKFGFAQSYMKGANYFLFGSVDSLLAADEELFKQLQKIDAQFYINIGFESADQHTLEQLGKPISVARVEDAFARMQNINDTYLNIEISGNFIMDESLSDNHYAAFLRLVRESLPRKKPKGCVYLSPVRFGKPSRELVFAFNRLKLQSRLPTFLYIIQRL